MTDYPVPSGIETSIKIPEARLLQRYAAGLNVLEIGTLHGFSAVSMALAGATVTSVDPHYEGPPHCPDTWENFQDNCHRYGLEFWPMPGWRIICWRQTIEEWARGMLEGWQVSPIKSFGLVFIDGDHGWPAPKRDIEIALAHLEAPGYIAMHDVTMNWPPVWRAAKELEESGRARVIAWEQTMRVFQATDYQK